MTLKVLFFVALLTTLSMANRAKRQSAATLISEQAALNAQLQAQAAENAAFANANTARLAAQARANSALINAHNVKNTAERQLLGGERGGEYTAVLLANQNTIDALIATEQARSRTALAAAQEANLLYG